MLLLNIMKETLRRQFSRRQCLLCVSQSVMHMVSLILARARGPRQACSLASSQSESSHVGLTTPGVRDQSFQQTCFAAPLSQKACQTTP